MTSYALFYHISHVELAAAVVRSNTPDAATCMNVRHLSFFQAVLPSALRPEHVRLQTSATGCEPCLTPAHTVHI